MFDPDFDIKNFGKAPLPSGHRPTIRLWETGIDAPNINDYRQVLRHAVRILVDPKCDETSNIDSVSESGADTEGRNYESYLHTISGTIPGTEETFKVFVRDHRNRDKTVWCGASFEINQNGVTKHTDMGDTSAATLVGLLKLGEKIIFKRGGVTTNPEEL